MDSRIKELLRPEILNTVNGLELVARVIVEGFMSGSNKSQTIGIGQEFSQYKNYQAGDDLRQLDWKMFARSERYFVKQSEVETNITIKFMLDISQSMAYTEQGMSKLEYARIMTAALAYLARKQSDTFGLYAVNDQGIVMVQPRFEQQQFVRFLNALIQVKAAGAWKPIDELEPLFDHHGKEIVVFITDMYDQQHDLRQFISRLKTPRNEVIVFHLMGREERDLGLSGSFTFEELETGRRTKVNTDIQRTTYVEKVNQWLTESRTWMLEKNLAYYLVSLDTPIESTLRDFLTIRKRLVR